MREVPVEQVDVKENDMNNINLKDMVGGALQEKFSKSFERVLENMQDANTPFKPKREINIKISFAQNESRDDVAAVVKVSEKLAPQGELVTHFTVGKDYSTGKIFANEYGNQVKGQMTMDLNVDNETGEIIEEENVVDLRKVK